VYNSIQFRDCMKQVSANSHVKLYKLSFKGQVRKCSAGEAKNYDELLLN